MGALQERARNISTIYTVLPASLARERPHAVSVPSQSHHVARGESQMRQIKEGQEVVIAVQGQGQGQGTGRIMRGCRQRFLAGLNK